jgi:hypothetical protein
VTVEIRKHLRCLSSTRGDAAGFSQKRSEALLHVPDALVHEGDVGPVYTRMSQLVRLVDI